MHVCAEPGCPTLTAKSGRCPTHARATDRARGNAATRGYARNHQQLRDEYAPMVDAGMVRCWRCRDYIQPGTPWDLGHDDTHRTVYRGPEHQHCNRAAAGRKAHASGIGDSKTRNSEKRGPTYPSDAGLWTVGAVSSGVYEFEDRAEGRSSDLESTT